MSYGYSAKIIRLNIAADPELLGVRLGRVCISKNISVIEVARELRVTRQTIYNWFYGETVPTETLAPAIESYISSLV